MAVDRSRLPELGPDPDFTFPTVRKQTAADGLRVWTVEHRSVPIVALLLLLPVGAATDPADRPGLAAVTGDLLDEGCGDRSGLEVHDSLARIGAQFDTEVGADATIMTLTTLARFAARALELLADMAIRPRFEEAEFQRVRDLRLNRLVQLRNLPPAVADRVFAERVYARHPYGHLPIGTEPALRAMDVLEVVAFHRRWYRPGGATLIAVGDAEPEALAEAAARTFAGWPAESEGDEGAASKGNPVATPVSRPEERLALVHRAGAAQSELRVGHVAASRATPDYHALLVLNMVLGGQFVSRINLNLRETRGYTYGARTSFDFRRGAGPFVVQVSVQTDATAEAIREIDAEIRAIRGSRPASDSEVRLARTALTRGYPRGFETAEQIARGVAQLALYGLPDDYFSQFIPRVAAVDVAAATRVAQTHLHPDRLVTVVVGDRDRVGSSLDTLGLGRPLEVDVS